MMLTDVESLRVSVARIAQSLNVETRALAVTNKVYEELCQMAKSESVGWNTLAALCADKAQELSREALED
jgi:hypothetical protein